MPGRRSRILYRPEPSVTTVRTFSMRAGLDASTVTPGRTAPEVSFTVPAIAALAPLVCANAAGANTSETNAASAAVALCLCRISPPPVEAGMLCVQTEEQLKGKAEGKEG